MHTWNCADIPKFRFSKRVYLETLKSEISVAKLLLKGFKTEAITIGLKSAGYVNKSVITAVEAVPMSAYSKDNRRKVLHVTLAREAEFRTSEIITMLKEHAEGELQEKLDLYNLDKDSG